MSALYQTQADFVDALVDWLNRRVAPPGILLSPDTPLFEGGLINSLRILEVIAWTERALGRRIPDRSIRMDSFASASRIGQAFFEEGS